MKTYLDKDVRDLLQIKDMMQFHMFIRLCAGRVGSLFKASELANEIGISSHTVTAWLSVLQASYIVTLLPPYFENTRKRLTKTPKLYFMDTGLACYLLGIESSEQLSRDKMRGALFENFIVTEALKRRQGEQPLFLPGLKPERDRSVAEKRFGIVRYRNQVSYDLP